MEKDQFIWGIVIFFSILGLLYVGAQNISGEAIHIEGITCQDSDGGRNAEVYGECTDLYGMHKDSCGGGFNEKVTDYYCASNRCTKTILTCSAASLNPNYDAKLYYPRICQVPGQCGANTLGK